MTGAPALLRVAFLGGFSACFVEPVRARLAVPGMLAARAEVIASNIERVARGEPPLHQVPTLS